MTETVEKTVSLPSDIAAYAERVAKADGQTLSEFVEASLREARKARFDKDLKLIQSYWGQRARDKGIYTEEDLWRYLES